MVTQNLELKEVSAHTVEGYPLSPQQNRIRSLQQLASGTPYRVQGVLSIKGPLDVARLRTAVAMVVARHAILRTSFQYLPTVNVRSQLVKEEMRGNVCWEPDEDLSEQDAETHRATVER